MLYNPLRDPRDRRIPRVAGPCVLVMFGVTGDLARIPSRDLRATESFNAFYFTPAIVKNGVSLSNLFSTHPSLDKRLAQLATIEAELGRAS